MSKQWKITAANAFLQVYTRFGGNLKDKAGFHPDLTFNRIVIFSTTALGDLMFNTPAIRAVRERYPAARLTLISSHKNKQLVATSQYFDDVIYWDHKAKDILSIIHQLRKHKPELAIILHSKSPYDVIAAVTAGCQYVFKDAYGNKATGMEPWLSGVSRSTGGHLIQRKLDLVAQLGCRTDNTEMFIPVEFPAVNKTAGNTLIGFQMGASETLRCWPVERFTQLAKLLLTHSPHNQIELIGTPKELDIEKAFMAGLTVSEQQRVVSHMGKTTLPQLLGVMSNLQVLVTGDTGPLHLAIALKTPTVSLFVTANPQHTGPYQNSALHQVMYVPTDRVQLSAAQRRQPLSIITEQQVFDKVTNALQLG